MPKRYPEIVTVDLVSKDEIYSLTIPANVRSYTVKTRGNHEFKLAYRNGDIEAGIYETLPSGAAETEDGLGREDPITLYIQCEKDNETLEVKTWR